MGPTQDKNSYFSYTMDKKASGFYLNIANPLGICFIGVLSVKGLGVLHELGSGPGSMRK